MAGSCLYSLAEGSVARPSQGPQHPSLPKKETSFPFPFLRRGKPGPQTPPFVLCRASPECLPEPRGMSRDEYVKTAIPLGALVMLCFLQVYVFRLRRVIAAFYFPKVGGRIDRCRPPSLPGLPLDQCKAPSPPQKKGGRGGLEQTGRNYGMLGAKLVVRIEGCKMASIGFSSLLYSMSLSYERGRLQLP